MNPECHPPTQPKRTNQSVQPTLVLYLRDVTGIPYTSDAAVAEAFARDPAWRDLTKQLGLTQPLTPRRAFTSDIDDLRRLIDSAVKNAERNGVRGYRPLQFDHYFVVALPKGSRNPPFDLYCAMKDATKSRGSQVSFSMPARAPGASSQDLGAATPGVGALGLQHGTRAINGDGQLIIDVEKAWLVQPGNGTYLPNSAPVVESGELADISHGTAVASIILGDGAFGATSGIAPAVEFMRALSIAQNGVANPDEILPDTIVKASIYLMNNPAKPGVILIEQATWSQLPLEADPLAFAAIATAVAQDKQIVVQAAGNAARDLDGLDEGEAAYLAPGDVWTPRSLDPSKGGPLTNSIVVAAGRSGIDTTGQYDPKEAGKRSPESNFGNLVDCWAWGDSIAALTATKDESGNPIPIADPSGFGGTSGAAAIIAGAIALMQQYRTLAGNPPLTPPQVKHALRNFGTKGQDELATKHMPNLSDAGLLGFLSAP